MEEFKTLFKQYWPLLLAGAVMMIIEHLEENEANQPLNKG